MAGNILMSFPWEPSDTVNTLKQDHCVRDHDKRWVQHNSKELARIVTPILIQGA